MSSRKKNALVRLGCALRGYIKTTLVDKWNKQKHPVPQSKPKPSRRHQEYSEQQGIKSTNCVRFCIVQPDGTMVTVDVFNHPSTHARRRYSRR